MSMLLSSWSATRMLLDVNANTAVTYKRAIVESAPHESVRILDAHLKRHPWRGDRIEIELRWTCERQLKFRT
jgi:hypothetical protein